MKEIRADIGYRIEDSSFGIKYFGEETDNGICYKDFNAWKNNNGVIYIGEYELMECNVNKTDYTLWTKSIWVDWVRDILKTEEYKNWNEDFVEHLAYVIFEMCDWQDLSTKLNEIDIEEEIKWFNYTLCEQYVDNNFNRMMFDISYTYSKMCINRTNLKTEDYRLYEHINDLIDDFATDNDIEKELVSEFDIEDIFEKLLILNEVK